MAAEQIAQLLLDAGAVALNVQEPFRYTSGIFSPIYCDNRLLISHPEKRRMIVDALCAVIEDNELDFDVIGGTATAGIPWAAWIAEQLSSPMVYIRGKAKEHGKKKQVEGLLEEGSQVIIVEDLVSTGGSSIASVEGVRNEGGHVMDVVAIFTYEMEKAHAAYADAKVQLHTLCTFSTLVEVAADRGDISPEDKEKVLEWKKDPQGWGVRFGFDS